MRKERRTYLGEEGSDGRGRGTGAGMGAVGLVVSVVVAIALLLLPPLLLPLLLFPLLLLLLLLLLLSLGSQGNKCNNPNNPDATHSSVPASNNCMERSFSGSENILMCSRILSPNCRNFPLVTRRNTHSTDRIK